MTADQSYKLMLESELEIAEANFREYGDKRGLFDDPEWTWGDELAETSILLSEFSRPRKSKSQRRAERAKRVTRKQAKEDRKRAREERKKVARIKAAKKATETRKKRQLWAQQNGFKLSDSDIHLLEKNKLLRVGKRGKIKIGRGFGAFKYEIDFDKVRGVWVGVFVILGLNEGDEGNVRFESETLSQVISDLKREKNKRNKQRKRERERENEIKTMTDNWHRGFV